MGFRYDETTRIASLENGEVAYLIYLNSLGIPIHLHFGRKLSAFPVHEYLKQPSCNYQFFKGGRFCSLDDYFEPIAPVEVSTNLCHDLRPSSASVDIRGSTALDFRFSRFEKASFLPDDSPLPHARGIREEDSSFAMVLKDAKEEVELVLTYLLFHDENVLVRRAKLLNKTGKTIYVKKLASATYDLPYCGQTIVHFPGAWSDERNVAEEEIGRGTKILSSSEGRSGHEENPFFILKEKGTDEDRGICYGFNLIYSGSFQNAIHRNGYDRLRILSGINPENLSFAVAEGASFETPEAVISFSQEGMNRLSQVNHRFAREHVIDPLQKRKQGEVVFNSWEGLGMDFNTNSILECAKEAKGIGSDVFALDDGWFSSRDDDAHGLGDWRVNPEKIDLAAVVDEVHRLGMRFGIWIEPEGVSVDAPLYRLHPESVLGDPERERKFQRNQLVADFSQEEVVDSLLAQIQDSLGKLSVDYVKYDMNRPLGDAISSAHPQGEVQHRYTLGVYRFLHGLKKIFPHALLETCAGGGGRFDLGMLYFSPQIWASDASEADRRIFIQHGTSYAYPLSSISSHVSKASGSYPSKAHVAFFGTYGYEMDPRTLSQEEKAFLLSFEKTVRAVHKEVVLEGDFYRLLSPYEGPRACWMSVCQDRSTAVFFHRSFFKEVASCRYVKLRGLNREFLYDVDGIPMAGDYLMDIGLNLSEYHEEGKDIFIVIRKIEKVSASKKTSR